MNDKERHKQQIGQTIDTLFDLFIEADKLGSDVTTGTLRSLSKYLGMMAGLMVPAANQPPLLFQMIQSMSDGLVEGKLLRGDKEQVTVIVKEPLGGGRRW